MLDSAPPAPRPIAEAVGRAQSPTARARPEPTGDAAYLIGFLYLAVSNLCAKGAGLVRELLTAALFGTSPVLGMYVLLKSGVDAASATATGVFQLNIVPRLVLLGSSGAAGVDRRVLLADALRVGLGATVLSLVAMSATLGLTGYRPAEGATLVLILSLSLGLLLMGVLGLIGQQSSGRFRRMSGVYLLTAILMALLVYPLGSRFGVVGLALTWLISVTIQAVVVWLPALRGSASPSLVDWSAPSLLRRSDFKPTVLIAGNQMVLCLIVLKLLASLSGLEAVAVVNYALVLAGLFVTTITRNMSSVVLKAAADGLPWRRFGQAVGLQLAASAGIYLALTLYGEPAIRVLFERGAFDSSSTEAVQRFMTWVFPPLVLIGSLDLLVVYVNGRGLAVAEPLYALISAVMLVSISAAWAWARWGTSARLAPLVFVTVFGVTALTASSLLVWRTHHGGRP